MSARMRLPGLAPTLAPLALFVALALVDPVGCAAAPASSDAFASAISFDQHLDQRVPADLDFVDENGRAAQLGDFLGEAPLILVLSYYGCSNLCPTVLHNLAVRLGQGSSAQAHHHLQVVVVSVDPLDSPALAALAKRKVLEPVAAPEAMERWHFLTGAPAAIAQLARTVGFGYRYDEASHQYEHPAGFVLLTPEGKIARYVFGFDFTADQLSGALDQSAVGRIAAPVRSLLLRCFHFDPLSGRYSALIGAALRALCLVMLVAALWLARMRFGRIASPLNRG